MNYPECLVTSAGDRWSVSSCWMSRVIGVKITATNLMSRVWPPVFKRCRLGNSIRSDYTSRSVLIIACTKRRIIDAMMRIPSQSQISKLIRTMVPSDEYIVERINEFRLDCSSSGLHAPMLNALNLYGYLMTFQLVFWHRNILFLSIR